MERVMLEHDYDVIGTDLHPVIDGRQSVDFLTARVECDWIITNPPFSQAEKFIRHALDLRRPCAFLLKSQFWHARSRLALFREYQPAYVLPLTWRPDFLFGAKSGSPTMEILWTVWDVYDGGCYATEYIPLARPKMEVERKTNEH